VPDQPGDDPPSSITYGLDEALGLLATLEEAREALAAGPYLGVVMELEIEIEQPES
jgi:hypothetical protein